MEPTTNKLHPTTVGFGFAASLVIIASTVLVIMKEEDKALLAYMKGLTGHHWITQGILVMVAFLALGSLFSAMNRNPKIEGSTLSVLLFVSTAVASLGLIGYFLLPYIK